MITKDNIKGFKLVNGDQFIGVVQKVAKDGSVMHTFLPVTIKDTDDGWYLDYYDKSSADQIFRIPKTAILYQYDPAAGILKSYVETFVTPILEKAAEPSANEEGPTTGQ